MYPTVTHKRLSVHRNGHLCFFAWRPMEYICGVKFRMLPHVIFGDTNVTSIPTLVEPQLFGCFDDYHVSVADTATKQETPDAWDAFTGSWMDFGRDFPHAKVFHTTNSVATCGEVAKASGSAAFGMSKTSECWWVQSWGQQQLSSIDWLVSNASIASNFLISSESISGDQPQHKPWSTLLWLFSTPNLMGSNKQCSNMSALRSKDLLTCSLGSILWRLVQDNMSSIFQSRYRSFLWDATRAVQKHVHWC